VLALVQHDETVATHQADAERLRRARAAEPVAVLLRQFDRVDTELSDLTRRLRAAASDPELELDTLTDADAVVASVGLGGVARGLAVLLGSSGIDAVPADDLLAAADTLDGAARSDDDVAVSLDPLLALESAWHTRSDTQLVLDRAADQAEQSLVVLERHAAEHPAALADAETALTEATAHASGLIAARERVEALDEQAAAALALDSVDVQLAGASAQLVEARQASLDAQTEHLSLLQRHLEGIASVLAAQLVDGAPCLVCGGLEHPEPAQPRADDVTADQVERALQRYQQCVTRYDEQHAAHDMLQRRRVELVTIGGDTDKAELLAGIESARAVADVAARAASSLPELTLRRDELRARGTALNSEIASASMVLAASQERAAVGRAALDDDERHLMTARADFSSVAARRESLRRRSALRRELAGLTRSVAGALASRATAAAEVDEAARSHGFGGADDVRSAALGADELATLEDAITAWVSTRDHLAAEVAHERFAHLGLDVDDPVSLAATLPARLVDAATLLEATSGAHRSADTAYRRAEDARTRASSREQQLAKRRLDVLLAEERLEHVRAQTAAVVRLAGLAKGTGGELRMTLTTYVLRQWFERVVEAANLRLSTMSSGRYELERTGLSLSILDRHTGDSRSPSSLSGGETFYTSLALALGLADVVRAEAGGVDLDTLFIDEGFGSLDPDTLDAVMTVIDDLREGGRAVGIVSHVADLKDRIPERLEITRLEGRGSTTRVLA
jgi:exonuclease SbcC